LKHDRKREKNDEKTQEILKLKIEKYVALKDEILEFGKELKKKDISMEKLNEILNKTFKILSINPEFYSLWNYRKEVILKMKEEEGTLKKELELTENLLKTKAIKSYSVWLHR
jgi:geranylgeranyl transferase type-2 subunit alpha